MPHIHIAVNRAIMAFLNFASQLRYCVEWFKEFSPMQKSDFLPILIDQFGPDTSMNGLPYVDMVPPYPSIFRCRIKLFTDWSTTWTHEEKQQFISSIRLIDSEFVEKFEEQSNFPSQPAN